MSKIISLSIQHRFDVVYKSTEDTSLLRQMTCSLSHHPFSVSKVIQRYITNPLLVHGRKVDLRAYLLVASTDPYIVLFRPGYVRLAMDQYDVKGKRLAW